MTPKSQQIIQLSERTDDYRAHLSSATLIHDWRDRLMDDARVVEVLCSTETMRLPPSRLLCFGRDRIKERQADEVAKILGGSSRQWFNLLSIEAGQGIVRVLDGKRVMTIPGVGSVAAVDGGGTVFMSTEGIPISVVERTKLKVVGGFENARLVQRECPDVPMIDPLLAISLGDVESQFVPVRRTLAERVKDLSLHQLRLVFSNIAVAVQKMHKREYLHLNLNPETIVVHDDCSVKLDGLDFSTTVAKVSVSVAEAELFCSQAVAREFGISLSDFSDILERNSYAFVYMDGKWHSKGTFEKHKSIGIGLCPRRVWKIAERFFELMYQKFKTKIPLAEVSRFYPSELQRGIVGAFSDVYSIGEIFKWVFEKRGMDPTRAHLAVFDLVQDRRDAVLGEFVGSAKWEYRVKSMKRAAERIEQHFNLHLPSRP